MKYVCFIIGSLEVPPWLDSFYYLCVHSRSILVSTGVKNQMIAVRYIFDTGSGTYNADNVVTIYVKLNSKRSVK